MGRLLRCFGDVSSAAWVSVVALAMLAVVRGATAQDVYTWTDERGVVHFSDVPPVGVPNVEKREVKPFPESQKQTAGGGGAAAPASAPAAVESGQPPSDQSAPGKAARSEEFRGPARVIATSREVTPRGPRSRHVIGSVKNVGGRAARRVAVILRVADSQGGECLREEVDVAPSTLGSGETGNFDTTIDTPCFLEDAGVDIEPSWD